MNTERPEHVSKPQHKSKQKWFRGIVPPVFGQNRLTLSRRIPIRLPRLRHFCLESGGNSSPDGVFQHALAARAVFLALAFFTLVIVSVLAVDALPAGAARVDELKEQIGAHNSKIEEIEAEIAKYRNELNAIGQEKRSLQGAINELDVSRNKLAADIRLTEERIYRADLEIEEVQLDIADKERRAKQNVDAIAQTLRRQNEAESTTLVEAILLHDNLAEVWDDLATLEQFQSFVRGDLDALRQLKRDLENQKAVLEGKRQELELLYSDLGGQKSALDANRSAKNDLLEETKSEESAYQELLAEKEAEKEAFEAELRRIESQLQYELDPNTIPAAGEGVLAWPFSTSYMQNCPSYQSALGNSFCLTQYFGNTQFAQSAAYKGQGHNGVDFRAPLGTAIRAALSGTVVEVNHGVAPYCQYGKWVLIRHNNGLTTLYAHLSSITVGKGQQVTTGQNIGFSGSTGYSTGPHLHFTVYVSEAVSFKQYKCNSGPTVLVPVAPFNAYINPLLYL